MISVIIPTLNEENNQYFRENLEYLGTHSEVELIVSDGGSEDRTVEMAEKLNIKVIRSETQSRASRINKGIKAASSEMILLNHPRSVVYQDGIDYLIKNKKKLKWGGFHHSFDRDHFLLDFTSWYSNKVRSKRFGIVYLDHCIYLTSEVAHAIGDIPSVEIFEDTILSKKIRIKFGLPLMLPFVVKTSSIRFSKNGILKQICLNQYLKLKYYFGEDDKKMNKIYESELALNTKNNKKP